MAPTPGCGPKDAASSSASNLLKRVDRPYRHEALASCGGCRRSLQHVHLLQEPEARRVLRSVDMRNLVHRSDWETGLLKMAGACPHAHRPAMAESFSANHVLGSAAPLCSAGRRRPLSRCGANSGMGWRCVFALAMSLPGRVSRAWPVHTVARNCTRDGGGPSGFGDQVADPKPP